MTCWHNRTFALLAALVLWASASVASAQTTYEPVDDAWVVTTGGGSGVNLQDPDVAYGVEDENRLWVRAASSLGRGTYLKFDLSDVEGPVTEALLEFTVDIAVNGETHTVYVYELDEDTWTEDTITGSNAPEAGEELGTASTPVRPSSGTDTTFVFDVTEYVNEALGDEDKLVSFMLGNPTANTEDYDATDLRIFSKEAFLQGDGPLLTVTGGAGTPVERTEVPEAFAVEQNYPNPFNPQTSLRYEAPEAGHLRIAVYNLLGQEVATLFEGTVAAGEGVATWDGRDQAGRSLGTGVYVARFEFGDHVQTIAMTLLR